MSKQLFHVVTLCGSMRFKKEMMEVAERETVAMHIVIMPFSVVRPDDQNSAFKAQLDAMHLVKITMADEVVVVYDETHYIGESTRREIVWAESLGIPVRYEEITLRRIQFSPTLTPNPKVQP